MEIITITIGILLGFIIKSKFSYIKSLFKSKTKSKEVNKKVYQDYDKAVKVIESCNSWYQYPIMTKYIEKFKSKWGSESKVLCEELEILLSVHFSSDNKKLKLGVKESSLGKIIDWLPEPEPKKDKYYGN